MSVANPTPVAFKEASAVATSPAWSPGRRGFIPGRGAPLTWGRRAMSCCPLRTLGPRGYSGRLPDLEAVEQPRETELVFAPQQEGGCHVYAADAPDVILSALIGATPAS